MENNACKEWIKEMRAYMSYYEKRKIFANKKEMIDFVQGYLKDTAKRIWFTQCKYVERFFIGHI